MDSMLTVSGATSGKVYKFKVETRNIIGFSDFSEELAIKAAIIPTAPNDV
jgi:hypothetical protein